MPLSIIPGVKPGIAVSLIAILVPVFLAAPILHLHVDRFHGNGLESNRALILHAHLPLPVGPAEFESNAEHATGCLEGSFLFVSSLGASRPSVLSNILRPEIPAAIDPPALPVAGTRAVKNEPHHPPPELDSASLRSPPA
jgi:hypothetical protein